MRLPRRGPLYVGAAALVLVAALAVGLDVAYAGHRSPASAPPTTSRPGRTTPPATTAPGTTAPTTTAPPAAAGCVATVATWPATRLASQSFMVIGTFGDFPALDPEAGAQVGGFVFLGQPTAGAASAISSGIATLAARASGTGDVVPWFSTDEEGGEVTRLANVLGPLPSPREMASEWTTTKVQTAAEHEGEGMRSLGLTMDLAPVLDTAAADDPVDAEASRSFGTTPGVASAYGQAFAAGLERSGVVPVVKHFPGLGHADANTDEGPATDPPLATLEGHDLIPFERAIAAGDPVVMVSNATVPGLTAGLPATLSTATYTYLRTTMGFSGLTMTDSLAAGAVSDAGYSEPAAAVAALGAGADLVMVDAATWAASQEAVVAALSDGQLARAEVQSSVEAILRAKGITTCAGH